MKKIVIKSGRDKSLLRRHPWVFSGAIKNIDAADSGDIVKIVAEDGRYLATAAFSAPSQIAARVLSFDEKVVIDESFYRQRIAAAISRRSHLPAQSNAYRLIHGESDGLPGVVADLYGDVAVLQLSTAGIESQRLLLANLLIEATGARTVYERSDADVRKLEGLEQRNGLVLGEPLTGAIQIVEGGMTIEVDIVNGHKTGFYLDQRDNRAITCSLAKGRDVLNCFCYSATMSTAAMLGGAKTVISIDSSAPALVSGRHIAALNNIDPNTMEWVEADVFAHLRKLRDQGRSFDLIILDPPKLAPTTHHVEKASRAYKDINLLGFKLLRPGGMLMTYSCSGGVSVDLFQKIVAGAALDAGVDAQITRRLSAGTDHPVSIHFPEGEYLKGLLLTKMV
ncbi:MAG: class I SAM-dependent rRNA methyltransferase [Burkholderiales bacterium]|nr:class I SAM-dependent rRNA methyltransferase [Rhodocyclaceae bacterium]MCA3023214.1 class I SAM-dependent rRNA methyltransferase [Rhodocyclaceae bacterium]MCA3053401.1 class I SAM-dependent rRNA methyltransferase [Rhodocyclaceae bacterium]